MGPSALSQPQCNSCSDASSLCNSYQLVAGTDSRPQASWVPAAGRGLRHRGKKMSPRGAPELQYAKTHKQDVSVFDSRKFLTTSLINICEYPL
jgi:hypothetical protein